VLVAEPSPHGGLGQAINDRLERASAGTAHSDEEPSPESGDR
jgi:hypothetical protein